MNINIEELKQLDDSKILKLFIPMINDIYRMNDYALLSLEEFYDLILEEIKKSKKKYVGNIPYVDYLRKKIVSLVNKKIKKCLLDPSKEKVIINNYINKYFNDVMSCDDAIKRIEQFNLFLETYNYTLNPYVLVEIIEKNNNFSKALQLIVRKYNSYILSENLEDVITDYKLIFMIKTYCEFNDINIDEYWDDNELDLDLGVDITNNMSIFRRDIKKYSLLSIEEERKLTEKIALGDEEAREKFINSNLRLVLSISRKYVGAGLSYDDIVQEGIIGLTTAVDKYDANKGYKFSTYATYWIKQSIIRAITDKGRTIRIPVYLYDRLLKYQRIVSELSVDLGRTPTKKEMAEKMQLTESEITKLMELTCDTISLNTFICEEDERELESLIPSDDSSIENAMNNIMRLELYKFLDNIHLSSREKAVLFLRFGLDGNGVKTLDDIGEIWNLSRERVRQINDKTLYKIRRSPYINPFALYMENPTQALKVVQEIQKQDNNKIIEYKTIYEYFSDCKREDVDKALKMLTSNEYEFIKLNCVEDTNKPIYLKLNQAQCYYLTVVIVPKIKKIILKNKKIKIVTHCDKVEDVNCINTMSPEIKEPDISNEQCIDIEYDKIENEDYEKVLKLLMDPTFSCVMNKLNSKEIIIAYLKFGYVSGKCFSNIAIAEFLKLDEREVEDAIAKALFLYKNQLSLNQETTKKLIKKMVN